MRASRDPRVVVALVHRRVRGEEVHVALPLDVPEVDALAPLAHDVERVVVVRAVAGLDVDEGLRLGRGRGNGHAEPLAVWSFARRADREAAVGGLHEDDVG